MKHTSLIILSVALVVSAFVLSSNGSTSSILGGVETDVVNTGFVVVTSTVNTTATQVFASVTSTATLINFTSSTFTCKPDDQGTTVASSTVVAGAGFILSAHQATTTNVGLPSQATFGRCVAGMYNCVPFKGTLNCVANVAAVITKVSN